jgi:iron uptake system component EfeO
MRRVLVLAALLGFGTPPALAAGPNAEAFRPYAASLIDRLVIGTARLDETVEAGDLEAAKAAWIAARVGWERGETFLGEYFPDADEAIDSWPDPEAGFHAVEPILFKAGDVEGARTLTKALLADVKALEAAFAGQAFDAQGLANGLAGIAFEIGDAKADGGESPFAGTSLSDMQDNMIGIEALYGLSFAPALRAADPALHARIVDRMIELVAALQVASIEALDQTRVAALSERLAGDLQDAALTLGLERPMLGG